MKIDIQQADTFLNLFNYQLVTFQFLKRGKPAGYYTCNYPLTEDDWAHLETEHKNDSEIFFMVNEGDGVIYPGKKIPRSQKNVKNIKSLFIDTDDCPLSEVKVFLKDQKVKPHLVVETSPKKYHLYFLLEQRPELTRQHSRFLAQQKNWKQTQHILSHLGTETPKTDSSVKDISRVLRVPGFRHLKNPKAPFLTRIVKQYTHQHYSLDEMLQSLQLGCPLHSGTTETGHSLHNQYQLPDETVNPGNRHHQMASLLGHLLNRGVDPEVARLAFYHLAETTFKDGKKFLPNGERHEEVDSFIKFKLEDIKQEDLEEQQKRKVQILDSFDNTSFELPDDFYLNAPGIAGEITREITKHAHYPLPSFAFATAVSLLSVLKGKSIKLQDGTPPANYFIALAPTGAGKNYAKEVMQHTLYSLNKTHLLEAKVRSDRGVLNWLNRNDSLGVLFMDEAEELLKSMESEHSGQHIRNFKTLLLEVYSSYNVPQLSFGEIASKKETPVVLSYPHLSSVIMGTPNILDSAFTAKSVSDGLFQRFNVIYTKQPRKYNQNSKPAQPINGNTFKQLNNLIRKTAISIEEGSTTISIPKATQELKTNALKHFDTLYNEELNKGTNLEGIFTRAVEKALRLATAITESDILDPTTFQFALTFIEHNTKAMRQLAYESFSQSNTSKEMKDLQRFVAKNSKNDQGCSYRNILTRFRIRDSRQLKTIIQDCIDAEMLTQLQIQPTKKGGRPGVSYALGRVD